MKKKSLLLIAALAVTASVSAQRLESSESARQATTGREYTVVEAQKATDAQRTEQRRARKIGNKSSAWYYRPAGSFYVGPAQTGGLYYSPQIVTPVYRENTFISACDDAAPTWWFSYYTNKATDSISSQEQNLTYTWGWEQVYAPTVVTAANQYQLYDDYLNRTTNESTMYKGYISSVYQTSDIFSDPAPFVSPKYWSAGQRERALGRFPTFGGKITLTGAAAAENQSTGYWFGRNASGYNGMAVYVEAPTHRYALRQIGIDATFSLQNKEAVVEIPVEVYSVAEHSADTLVFGDLLASGVAVIDSLTSSDTQLNVPLVTLDEDGIESEVVLDINQAIAVVVKGYDNPDLKDFYMYCSTDICDEGYGELGYILHCDADGTIANTFGLSDFFTSSLGNTAPSILLDVEFPMIDVNFDEETGEYNFPVEGGKLMRDYVVSGQTYTDQEGIYFVSRNHASDEWIIDEQPEWLTIELQDGQGEDGYYNNIVIANVTCQALPEGTTYREANVRFHYAGAEYIYKFSQGEKGDDPDPIQGDVNGDGKVEIDDVNALINILLGKAEATAAANVDGVGGIDVQDVNVLINIILGK